MYCTASILPYTCAVAGELYIWSMVWFQACLPRHIEFTRMGSGVPLKSFEGVPHHDRTPSPTYALCLGDNNVIHHFAREPKEGGAGDMFHAEEEMTSDFYHAEFELWKHSFQDLSLRVQSE